MSTARDARPLRTHVCALVNLPAGVEVHATIADALVRDRFVTDPFAQAVSLIVPCVFVAALVAAIVFVLPPVGLRLWC